MGGNHLVCYSDYQFPWPFTVVSAPRCQSARYCIRSEEQHRNYSIFQQYILRYSELAVISLILRLSSLFTINPFMKPSPCRTCAVQIRLRRTTHHYHTKKTKHKSKMQKQQKNIKYDTKLEYPKAQH